MRDYTATITITVSLRAANEEQAQERADSIGAAASNGITHMLGKKAWLGDEEDIEVEVEEDE